MSLYINGLRLKRPFYPHLFKETTIMPLHNLKDKNALPLLRKDNTYRFGMKMNGERDITPSTAKRASACMSSGALLSQCHVLVSQPNKT